MPRGGRPLVTANLIPASCTFSIAALAFAAYLPADALHVSGVLAVVTAGLCIGWKDPRMVSARTRLQSVATWEETKFLLKKNLKPVLSHWKLPALVSRCGCRER